ncbi:MAG: hypothetical protein KAX69_00645 [Chitinophagales bacterium]|jgi:hypothetical protein|nr:hypothetical protein [Chitinophagales bacterium]HNY54076.1 hypothetical protein [Chitinophagales bacterium]
MSIQNKKNKFSKNISSKGNELKQPVVSKAKEAREFSYSDFTIVSAILLSTFLLGLFLFVINVNDSSYNILDRKWGFDNMTYLGIPIACSYFVLILLLFGFCFKSNFNSISERINNLKIKKWHYFIFVTLTCCLAFVLFYTFRIKYFLLGDMNLRVAQTLKQVFLSTEYLTMKFIYLFHVFLNKLHFKYSGEQTFKIQSILSGVLFIGTSLLLFKELYKKNSQLIFSIIYFIFNGFLLFYFGYIEVYSLPAFTFLFYLYISILVLNNKLHYIFAIIALAIAVGFHNFSLILMPSLFYVLYKKTLLSNLPLNKIPPFVYFISGILSLGLFYKIGAVLNFNYFLPFSVELDDKRMTLFSIQHIWEFCNAQFLGGGSFLFLICFCFLPLLLNKGKRDSISNFLLLGTFFSILFTFSLDAQRGSGDWDIYSFPCIVASIFVIYYLFLNTTLFASKKGFILLLLTSLLFNIYNSTAWFIINHTDKSISKIENMLINDPGSYYQISLPAEMGLAINFRENKLAKESLKFYKLASEKYPYDARALYNYASLLFELKKINECQNVLEKNITNSPYYANSYPLLISIYANKKLNDSAFYTVKKLHNSFIVNPNAFISKIAKNELLSYFQYLYQIDVQSGNQKESFEVANSINLLK